MSKLRIALVGCGRVAGHHATFVNQLDGMELAAVCDLVEEKAADYGKTFGVPHYLSYREMFDRHPEIDIVAVITPSGMHAEHAFEIIERYRKHVIVEKPTFMRPGDVVKAYQLADQCGVHVFPVFQNRYNKAVCRVRRALDEGELGDPRIVSVRVRWCRPQRYYDLSPWRGTFSHDGGCLTNQGIHHVDLIRHLGGEVAKVTADMATLGADVEIEDAVCGAMRYRAGALGSLEVTTSARPDDFEATISIVGSKGLAQIGGIAVNELQIFTPDPSECQHHSEDFQGLEGRGKVYGYGHRLMYEDIRAFFAEGRPFPVDRADCLGTIRLLHSFYAADEAGGWVSLDDLPESSRLGRPDDALSDLYRTPEQA